MALSVTCQCGARLEIDEKFLGKVVPCPDCQRPLPTDRPATPPPLDLPDNRRMSGLAVLSLTLALVGAFTLVGTLAAIGVGVLALREIARRPHKLVGAVYARAGIITGAVLTFLTLAAFISPTIFGLDVFFRELALAGRVVERNNEPTIKSSASFGVEVEINRPSDAWGKYVSRSNQSVTSDPLIIVNIDEDAYIACQTVSAEGLELPEGEERKKKVLERFYKSELVNLLGRLEGRPLNREGTIVEEKPGPGKNGHEIVLDLRLARIDRRFLIRAESVDHNTKLQIVVGAARKYRFDRMKDEFRKAFDSAKFRN